MSGTFGDYICTEISVSHSCSAAGAVALMQEEKVLFGGSPVESPPFLSDGEVYTGHMRHDETLLRWGGTGAPI